MKILVTGGAGFIGSRTVLRLLESGHECRVLDNLHPQIHTADPDKSPTWCAVRSACPAVIADIRDANALQQALEGCDAVLHLAAETGTGQSMYQVSQYAAVNVAGTAALLEALAQQARRICRFVVASSRSVYGEGSYSCLEHGVVTPATRTIEGVRANGFEPLCPECRGPLRIEPTSEGAALSPASVYAVTKLTQEQLAGVMCTAAGIPWFALRYQNVYGPGQSLNNPYTGVLSIFSRLMTRQADLEIFEDGHESRDFVYIDDVVDANVAALTAPAERSGVANIGSGAGTSIARLVELLAAQYQYQGRVSVTGRFRSGDIRHNVAATGRASQLLGFRVQVPIEEGVRRFCDWARRELAATSNEPDTGYRRSLVELEERGLIS